MLLLLALTIQTVYTFYSDINFSLCQSAINKSPPLFGAPPHLNFFFFITMFKRPSVALCRHSSISCLYVWQGCVPHQFVVSKTS